MITECTCILKTPHREKNSAAHADAGILGQPMSTPVSTPQTTVAMSYMSALDQQRDSWDRF
jgi:hypothetical protein